MTGLDWPLCVPVLADEQVTLRAHRPDDLGPMLEMATDPDMVRWTAIPVPSTAETTQRFAFEVIPRGWDNGSLLAWAIEVDGHYAGNVDIRGAGPLTDIGFALHPAARGRGIMRRAVDLAIQHAFNEAGKEIVHWRAHVGNEASLRVAHACGFTLHAVLPGLLEEGGRVHDAWTASIRFGDAPLPRTPWLASTIETGRLRLRPIAERDLPRLVESCRDPATRHFLAGLPQPYRTSEAAAFRDECVWLAAKGSKANWAVVDRQTDAFLADVTVMDLDGRGRGHGEIGYWAHPDARGRGIVSEAVRAAVQHAFDPVGLDLSRLTLYAAASNTSSNRIAQQAGFTEFGTQTAAERLGDGTDDDLVGYELLR